jgi:hypothetical protein
LRRVAALAFALTEGREAFEDCFNNRKRLTHCRALKQFVRALIQCASKSPDGLVVNELDFSSARAFIPVRPCTHQGVLQNGKLVRFVTGIVENMLDQSGIDLGYAKRTLNSQPSLLAI